MARKADRKSKRKIARIPARACAKMRRPRPTARRRPASASASSRPSWRFSPRSELRPSRLPRSPTRPACRSPSCAISSRRRLASSRLMSSPSTALCSPKTIARWQRRPARERLFDVLMRRLEIMAPYRDAVRSLLRSARSNPPLALALNGLAVRSQQWMLDRGRHRLAGAARDDPRAGPRRAIRRRVADLGQRRRFWPGPDHGGARSRARARPALCRPDGRCLPTPGAAPSLARPPAASPSRRGC